MNLKLAKKIRRELRDSGLYADVRGYDPMNNAAVVKTIDPITQKEEYKPRSLRRYGAPVFGDVVGFLPGTLLNAAGTVRWKYRRIKRAIKTGAQETLAQLTDEVSA